MIRLSITSGEEILEKITKYLAKKKINEGTISVIGAIDECGLSTMPKHDAKRDIIVKYREPLELSGTGEVHQGKPHLHVVLGREGNSALAGHLHWGKVKHWFVNVYITPLESKS